MKIHVLSILTAFSLLSGVDVNAASISATTNSSDSIAYAPTALLFSFRPYAGHVAEARVLDAVGGAVDYEYTLVPNLVRVRLTGQTSVDEAITALSYSPFVEYAEPDYIVHTQDAPPPPTNDPLYNQLWGLDKIHAPDAWTRGTGSSDVVVAVIDTGADFNHADLTVFGLISDTLDYTPADNHDPDGDSTGTLISVAQP